MRWMIILILVSGCAQTNPLHMIDGGMNWMSKNVWDVEPREFTSSTYNNQNVD